MTLRASLARAAAAFTLAAMTTVVLASGAHADSLPFTDPNANATIGFCDQSGNQVTSGLTTDRPFAWTAVSSAPAPAGYTAADHGKASLFAFQPRQYTDPGEWTGSQMTAGSVFSSDAHPMAAATTLDPSMADILSAFPAYWDGYFQLRMFFGAPEKQQLTATYPAAVIKVSGDTWTLVSGGSADCGSGKAVSTEKAYLPAATFAPQPAASSTTSQPASGSASAAGATKPSAGNTTRSTSSGGPHATKSNGSSSTTTTAPGATTSSGRSGQSGGSATTAPDSGASGAHQLASAAAGSRRSSSTLSTLVIGSVVIVAALCGAVFWWARRRA